MQKKKFPLNRGVIREFMKYVVVGGVAFLADGGVLALFYYVFLNRVDVLFWNHFDLRTIFSTAAGFTAGLIINYILSTLLVFNKETQKNSMGRVQAFTIYAVVGIVGLLLTELGMSLGRLILNSYYTSFMLIVKVVVAGIVLVWNYLGRKIFVYKWA